MNTNTESILFNLLAIIKEKEIWINFVKNFNEEYGFMWTRDPLYFEILDALNQENVSPAHFALYMRSCQTILLDS